MKAEKAAIFFIEFQNEFCKEGGKLHGLVCDEMARNRTIENAVRLLDGSRRKNARIIHIPFVLDSEWIEENHIDGLISNLNEIKAFAKDSWGGAIIDELKPRDLETVLLRKRALSAFFHTQMNELLHDGPVESIGVCGFLTNVCVQATAWCAYDLGYKVRIIPEACCATSQANQEYVEREICPILGGAPTVDEFLNEID